MDTTTDASAGVGARNTIAFSLSIIRQKWWITILSILGLGLCGLLFSWLQTPIYSASTILYVTAGSDSVSNAGSAYQGTLASQQRVASYLRLARSEAVVAPAIQESGLGMSVKEAKDALSASSTPDTVLMNITAKHPAEANAVLLANSVARSMVSYVQSLEQPDGGGRPFAKLTVVSPASESGNVVSPRTSRNVAVGLVAGLFAGLIISLGGERFRSRVRTADDVRELSDVPVIGVIPGDIQARGGIVDFAEDSGHAAEEYRRLRTNIEFSRVDSPPRCLLVTSPFPSEGKTTTAVNLAAAFAETGARVLLVDADMRRSTIHERLGVNGAVGVSNALRGDSVLSDLVQESQVPGLSVLAAGFHVPNPVELLASRRASELVADFKATYDMVIIDTPPVLPVADAIVAGQHADGVIVVLRSGQTKKSVVSDVVEQMAKPGSDILGFVINDVRDAGISYTYTYSYSRSVSEGATSS